ncbi:MAG: hypothetical protein LJE68_13420 [Rhodobacter sp.]|nr:hypothetical protein [Rhodobacter sp.]
MPPLIFAIALAQLPTAALTRICLILALAVAVPGIPMTYVWWRVIGAL